MKQNIQTVYLVGLGAIGSAYGSLLHKYDPSLLKVLVSPKRKADYMRAGIRVNGVISEDIIGDAIGIRHMLYAYSTAVASQSREDRWSRECPSLGKIFFGEEMNETLSPRVKAIKELFDAAGVPCDVPKNMIRAQWTKFMINTGINQASAVLGVTYAAFHKEGPARELALMAAAEVVAISKQCGVNLDETDINYMVSLINSHNPTSKNSMLQDIESGRKTEVDNFSGAVIRLGRQYKAATPVNETLYLTIKGIEERAQPTASL